MLCSRVKEKRWIEYKMVKTSTTWPKCLPKDNKKNTKQCFKVVRKYYFNKELFQFPGVYFKGCVSVNFTHILKILLLTVVYIGKIYVMKSRYYYFSLPAKRVITTLFQTVLLEFLAIKQTDFMSKNTRTFIHLYRRITDII